MQGLETLIALVGYVALLLWGVRMVRTGVTRSFTAQLRLFIARLSRHRLLAFTAGLATTAVLQSATATGLILSSFVMRDLMALPAAVAAMLGADVGTTVAAFVFSIDISWLPPLLIGAGVFTFLSTQSDRWRSMARIAIGLGLTLLSLRLLGQASFAMRQSHSLMAILAAIEDQPLLLAIIGGIVAWLAHSSLSIVILVMSLAGAGVLTLPVACALVVGANVGTSAAPLIDQLSAPPEARRLPLANLMMRGSVALVVLAALLPLSVRLVDWLGLSASFEVLAFHVAFNLLTAAVFLPLIGPVAKLVTRMLKARPAVDDRGEPRYLDNSVIDSPTEAIACATRETLALGDLVAGMLTSSWDVLERNDSALLKAIEATDDHVDELHEAIKLYLVKLSKAELSDAESLRYVEILTFVTNLEHIGDIIHKSLMEVAAKKIRNRLAFSREGRDELRGFHERVLTNLRLSFSVFTSHDRALARKLIAEKAVMRDIELAASDSHFSRLRDGRPESIETSAIHLDIVRDLKRINGHLTSVAYPILEAAGDLLDSRLKLGAAVAGSRAQETVE